MPNLDLIQWPAMATTLVAGWLVASGHRGKRDLGFWLFLVSNVLWVVWGMSAYAYALIALQFGLAFSNVRGVLKNRSSVQRDG